MLVVNRIIRFYPGYNTEIYTQFVYSVVVAQRKIKWI